METDMVETQTCCSSTRTTLTRPSSSWELLETLTVTTTMLRSIDLWTGELEVASTFPSLPGESWQI